MRPENSDHKAKRRDGRQVEAYNAGKGADLAQIGIERTLQDADLVKSGAAMHGKAGTIDMGSVDGEDIVLAGADREHLCRLRYDVLSPAVSAPKAKFADLNASSRVFLSGVWPLGPKATTTYAPTCRSSSYENAV